MRIGRTLAAMVASVAIASPAMAAPAVIKVFEAKAHEAPAADSPVLGTLPENAQVSVSEEVTAGWRRVRLADGRVAFIRDTEVTLAAPPTAPYPPPAAAGQTSAPIAPIGTSARPARDPSAPAARIYVKDLDHLAELVKSDNIVYPKAKQLADRRTMGIAIGAVTAIGGVLLMILSATAFASKNCDNTFSPPICTTNPSIPALVAGGIAATVGPLVGYAAMPHRNDVLDVVNEWNTRHVDQPFTIDRETALGH